jgi:hypothetical protein
MDKIPAPALASLAESIDDFLWEHGIDRSSVLEDALREFLCELLDVVVADCDA